MWRGEGIFPMSHQHQGLLSPAPAYFPLLITVQFMRLTLTTGPVCAPLWFCPPSQHHGKQLNQTAAAPAPANKDKANHQLQTHLDLAVPWAMNVQTEDGPELHSSIPQCPDMTSHLCLKNLTQDKNRALNSSKGTWFQERSSGFHRSTETKVYRDRF